MCATADHLSSSTKKFLFTYMLYMKIYAKQNIRLHLAVKADFGPLCVCVSVSVTILKMSEWFVFQLTDVIFSIANVTFMTAGQ